MGVTPDPFVPSPKSHENVGLTTVDDDAFRNTVSLIPGEVGENVKLTEAAGSVDDTVIVRDVVAV